MSKTKTILIDEISDTSKRDLFFKITRVDITVKIHKAESPLGKVNRSCRQLGS